MERKTKQAPKKQVATPIQLGERLVSEVDLFSAEAGADLNASNGVSLDESQRQYMLPHFLMMLVGKPGSGKTSLIQKLVNSKKFYLHKFDKIFLVSPSYQKMGILVDDKSKTADFKLDWIFDKIDGINTDQGNKAINSRTKKMLTKYSANMNAVGGAPAAKGKNSAFNSLTPSSTGPIRTSLMEDVGMRLLGTMVPSKSSKHASLTGSRDVQTSANILEKIPAALVKALQPVNVLFIFDDVVGQIKQAESDPRLAKLFFNRRHLIVGGTISIMVVSQKYMRIPTHIRSNANWLILFKINPKDFNNVYEDAIALSHAKWEEIVQFVFDMDKDGVALPAAVKIAPTDTAGNNIKSYNTLGIWVEKDIYFKNFQRLIMQ